MGGSDYMKRYVKKLFNNLGYEIRRANNKEVFWQIDTAFNNLYEEAQMKTQMKATDNILRRQRHYTLSYLLKNIDLKSGDICELGCWRGLSAYQIASYIRQKNEKVDFYVFDSFQGLSEIRQVDRYEYDKRNPDNIRKQFACSLESVQGNLREFNFINYYKGWIIILGKNWTKICQK